MNKQTLKLYWKLNWGIYIISLLIQVIFFSVLFFVKGIWYFEILYFSFLAFLMMTIHFFYRYYKIGRIYSAADSRVGELNQLLLEKERSKGEGSYNDFIERLLEFEKEKENKNLIDRKNYKILIYRFIHQLKTPVSVIKLVAENNDKKGDFEVIYRNLNTIEHNLNQMLHMYRLDEFKNDFVAEPVCLRKLAKSCSNELKDYFISKSVYPKLEVSEEIIVYSDSKWMSIVIKQLLINGVKYRRENQSIYIRAGKEEERSFLEIIDEGMGIEKGDQERIFDLFYTGDNGRNNADSSGLGLYIVKSILDYLDHEILVQSQGGEGSAFKIIF